MHRCRSAYPGTPVWVCTAPAAYYGPSAFVRPAGQHTSPTTPVNENRPPLPHRPPPPHTGGQGVGNRFRAAPAVGAGTAIDRYGAGRGERNKIPCGPLPPLLGLRGVRVAGV